MKTAILYYSTHHGNTKKEEEIKAAVNFYKGLPEK